MTTTYTCEKCAEVYDVATWENINRPYQGLCPGCEWRAHLERANTIDHIAKGKQIKEETKP